MNKDEMTGYVDKIRNDLVRVREDIKALTKTLKDKEIIIKFQKNDIIMLKSEVEHRDDRVAELEAICNEAGLEI